MLNVMFNVFFFFKQKTAYEIVSRDWSSDVCSSDLVGFLPALAGEKPTFFISGMVNVPVVTTLAMEEPDRKSVV